MSENSAMFLFKVQVEELILTVDSSVKIQDKLAVELAIDETMIDPDKPIVMKLDDFVRVIILLKNLADQYKKAAQYDD